MTKVEWKRIEQIESLAIKRIREKYSMDTNIIKSVEESKLLFGNEYAMELNELLKCNSRKEVREKHMQLVDGLREIEKIPYRIAFHEICHLIDVEMIRIDAVEQYKKENSVGGGSQWQKRTENRR